MPTLRRCPVSWADHEPFLVLPALRSLGSIIDLARRRGATWVILRRAVNWQKQPLFYAFRTDELDKAARSSRLDMTAFEALELHEAGQSAITEGATRPETLPLPDTSSPSATRVVHLDRDARPVAVGQVANETAASEPLRRGPKATPPLGPLRGGGRGRPRAGASSPSAARPPSPTAVTAAPPKNGGAGTSPAAPPQEAVLSAQGPSEVQVGKEAVIDVSVALAGTATPLAHAVTTTLSTAEKIVAILTVQGDAIEPLDPRQVKLSAPSAEQASTTVFTVRAVREGRARVGIIFRQGGTELGTVAFAMQAVTREASGSLASGTAQAAARNLADDGVVLLIIDDDPGRGWGYRYRLVAGPPLGWDYMDFSSPPLKDRGKGVSRTAIGYVKSIYGRLDRATSDGGSGLARELRALGTDLSRQLFPSDLVRLLWEHRDKLETVHVKSWEPFIPWELARLRHPDTTARDERFLAEYKLVRSLNGASRPPGLRLQAWRYLAATYPNGLEEPLDGDVAVFTEILKERHIEATPIPANLDAIFDALNQPDFDVLHICCHGRAEHEDIEQSELIIGDRLGKGGAAEPITIDAVTVREEAKLAERGPLVFLNACESGRMGASLTAWGGWPRTFWDAGAAAFVGTSWPVEDRAARGFCEAFYYALIDGHTLADAAATARSAAKQVDDATWLAYKVYGHPGARRS